MQNSHLVTEALNFRTLLTSESDRACALMAGSYLDVQLGKLLKAVFVNDAKVADEFTEPSKALGTFSARIDLGYLLGLLSKEEHRDLHLIRKIRNDFGHDPTPIDFNSNKIASRASQLTHTWHDATARPRAHFTAAVMSILGTIDVALYTKKHALQKQNTAAERKEALTGDNELLKEFEQALENAPEDALDLIEQMRKEMIKTGTHLEEQILARLQTRSPAP